jgi:hypothetical protein
LSHLDLRACEVRPGVRRAGLPRQSPPLTPGPRRRRRRLVSRKWSGKTLADHRADRKAWLLSMLGPPDPDDTGRYRWETVTPNDPDFMTHSRRMLHVLAERARWHEALAEARRRAQEATGDHSAIGRVA